MTAPLTTLDLGQLGGAPFVPLDEWGMTQASRVLAAGLDKKSLDLNRKFYLGDHWQEAEGYIGPRPLPTMVDDQVAAALWLEIARGFTSRNVIKEVISRHTSGVMGHEPDWSFTPRRALKKEEKPNASEQKDMDAANAALTVWWDRHKVRERLQDAIRKLLYSGGKDMSGKTVAEGRAVLRLYIPPNYLASVKLPDGSTVQKLSVASIEDALSKIHLDVPDVEFAHVYREPTMLVDVGVCQVQPKTDDIGTSGNPPIEITYVESDAPSGEGKTVLGLIARSNATEQQVMKFDLGQRILMHEMNREPFISEQVRQQQRALNFAASMIPRNLMTSGFLRQMIINGLMPGEKKIIGGKEVFVPDPMYAGPGSRNWINGIPFEDAQGNPQITTPQIHEGQPIPPTPSIDGKNEHYRDILNECDQAHVLMNSDAIASGKSREQARGDYEQSLHITQTVVERAGRWLLETVLAWAEDLAGAPGTYTKDLRAVFDCQIDTGPLSDAERANDVAAVAAGTMSRETSMIRADITDTDAELRRINEQDGGNLEVLKDKATVYGLWIQAGLSEEAAAELSGLSEDEKKIIAKMVKDTPAPPAPALPGAPGQPARNGPQPVPARNGPRPTPQPARPAPRPAPARPSA